MIKLLNEMIKPNRFITIGGIILSLFIIVFGIFFKPLYIILGSILLSVFIGWLFFGDRIKGGQEDYCSKRGCIFYTICYLFLFTLSVLVIQFRSSEYEIPLTYFCIISAMAGFIFLGILSCPKNLRCVILLEIVMLGTSYIVVEVTIFPSVLGIDPWWHQYFTNAIVSVGHILPGYIYSEIPLFHVLIAQSEIITGLSYKSISVVAGAMVIIISAFITYLFGKKVLGSWKIGLIGALMVVTAESVIRMSYWLIPTSLAGIIVIVVVYLAFSTEVRKTLFGTFLILLLMFSVVLTHSVTSITFAVILIVTYLAALVMRHYNLGREILIPIAMPLFFISIMFSWWMYVSISYMVSLADFVRNGFIFEASIRVNSFTISTPFVESIVNNLGYFIFFSLGCIGILYLLSNHANTKMKIFGIMAVTPLLMTFSSLIIGGYYFQDRSWFFAELLMALPLGFGLYHLAGNRRIGLRNILVTSVVVGIVFLMIISPSANMTNATISPSSVERLSLTSSEMVTINFAHEKYPEVLAVDDYQYQMVKLWQNIKFTSLENGISKSNFTSYSNHLVLLRIATFTNESALDESTSASIFYHPDIVLERQGFNLIYYNGAVKCYHV